VEGTRGVPAGPGDGARLTGLVVPAGLRTPDLRPGDPPGTGRRDRARRDRASSRGTPDLSAGGASADRSPSRRARRAAGDRPGHRLHPAELAGPGPDRAVTDGGEGRVGQAGVPARAGRAHPGPVDAAGRAPPVPGRCRAPADPAGAGAPRPAPPLPDLVDAAGAVGGRRARRGRAAVRPGRVGSGGASAAADDRGPGRAGPRRGGPPGPARRPAGGHHRHRHPRRGPRWAAARRPHRVGPAAGGHGHRATPTAS